MRWRRVSNEHDRSAPLRHPDRVKNVNTLIRKGKVRIFKGRPGELQNTKRAVVTLEEGHRIDVTTGL